MAESNMDLITEESDGILIATLNRPDKLNALNAETMRLLSDAVIHFRDAEYLKVFLLRSTGRYFSSGADLKDEGRNKDLPQPRTAREIRETHRIHLNGMQRIYDEMEHIEKPFVVAHHAMCVGGGLEVSLSCDFRLAAKSAAYSFPEGLFGVLPASNGVSRLTRLCGPHWARWLVMGNKPVPAGLALTMGLVHQVYPDGTFEDEVMAFCRHLAKQNGEQMGAAKIAIELASEVGRDSGRHIERMANSALMLNPEYQARLQEYVGGVGRRR
jgi:enoyl-CoA hydratase/carnithine racemase